LDLIRPAALSPELSAALREVLGYLNFSSGSSDPKFLRNLDLLFRFAAEHSPSATTPTRPNRRKRGAASPRSKEPNPTAASEPWQALKRLILDGLDATVSEPTPLGDAAQARAVIELVFDHALPGYLAFHRDLLFHQTPGQLFTSYFIGRVAEAVLAQGSPWEETDRIVAAAVRELNDYLGYRPIAVLHNGRRIEPYDQERLRPVPLWIAGAGLASGPYHDVLELGLEILEATDADLLRQAWFDLAKLEELAFDPRAYDFDHPVHKRPNHHFGQWDLHRIDNRGYYRRFVLQQVTLDALSARAERSSTLPRDELLFEAAAVLAGTILMGSGTTGDAPDCHDSTVSLGTLLPHIAKYRDAFYEHLLERMTGRHATRLRQEAARLKQPFGGARQDLNGHLARLRASQLEHVHLALAFAQMGYPEAAQRQAAVVQVASARMMCDMHCRLATTHLELDSAGGRADATRAVLDQAPQRLAEIQDTLHRGIRCGAIVDPWNVLGFDAQFSLFHALENSVYDHRIDQLIDLVVRIFSLYVRLISEAAASGHSTVRERLLVELEGFADWWDQFATDQVSSVESVSGRAVHDSAVQVGQALAAWHQGGAAAGDVGFWREHVAEFQSPKTFARVAEVLLEKHDFVAAMALLIHWASQALQVALEEGEESFHVLAQRWLAGLLGSDRSDRSRLVWKMLDYLEANAEEIWQAPKLELESHSGTEEAELADEEEDDEDSDLFGAAYEGVVFRDSAADGIEGEMIEGGGPATDYELEHESERIADRLAFLSTVAGLWKTLALRVGLRPDADPADREALSRWHPRAVASERQLRELLASVQRFRIPAPSGSHESMVEYDRRRSIKDSLLERIIAACVETADAAFFMAAQATDIAAETVDEVRRPAIPIVKCLFHGDAEGVRAAWTALVASLRRQPILYIPLSRTGDPQKIVAARILHQLAQQLLAWLPRVGLLTETCELIDTVRAMEVEHPVGAGAVTEFDRLFEVGYKSMVDALVASSAAWAPLRPHAGEPADPPDGPLIESLQAITEPLLVKWLAHSQTLRLSVLERVDSESQWQQLVTFIKRYGHDLFTQYFMNMGNLRAILHQGVETWLARLGEQPEPDDPARLVEELDGPLPRADAVEQLSIILEAVVDNYVEYRDYNSTTTQSDRGEMLYTLLDFLRLKASYERTHWNLRPVVMAHEILVRRGRVAAAEMWRRAVAERTTDLADGLLAELAKLQEKYGMKLPTVADRLAERFIRPLTTDRVLALVRPAIEEVRESQLSGSFEQLEEECVELTREPTGVGLDLPDWLAAVEEEIDDIRHLERSGAIDEDGPIPQRQLAHEDVQAQLERLKPRTS
jgi:hypothetical protein